MTEAAQPRTAPGVLREAVREFVAAQSGRGLDIVSLEVVEDGKAIAGKVLTQPQARALSEIARAHGARLDIAVVADPERGFEEGWSEITVDVIDLWRTPERAGAEMGRQTQYMANDGPLRRLGRQAEWALVQGPDLALGWAAAIDLRDVAAGSAHPWSALARAAEGSSRPPARADASAAGVLGRARSELGVPYVWGGTTHAGFDCSGLVERVLLDATGVLMPRHTADQRRVGARVVAGEVQRGDLLFARPLSQKVGHVILMTSATTVLHACRTEHRVIEESLDDNARRYQHQGWRRPVTL